MNKEARNAAIDFHNRAMQTVEFDQQTAYRLICSAVTVDPSMAQGWYMLGNVTADLKLYPASIAAFRRALDLPLGDGPGDLTPDLRAKCLVNLGHRLLNDGRIEEAGVITRRALSYLEKHPDLDAEGRAFAWTNMSLVLSIQGETDESLRYAQEAFRQNPKPIVETGLGFAYLFAEDFANGLRHFDARFAYKLPAFLNFPYPRWDGAAVKTLFVAPDQGLGDTLSFARFVPQAAARATRLIFTVQTELVRMFRDAFLPWPNVEVVPASSSFPPADAWCPVVSLPTALGLTTPEIVNAPQAWEAPSPPGNAPAGWKTPDRKLHVGIAYGGAAANEIDRWRSIPVAAFLDLYQAHGVQLYSLQVGERAADLHAAGAAGLIRDMSPWIRDVADTVAIMRELDLVITIESFIGHLAGALNHPCWVLYSHRGGDYRIGRDGRRALWYPNHRIFKQDPDGEWGPVFERVVAALKEKVG